MSHKHDLPSKICPVCGLSFTWRKKWRACWQDVKFCSERCRRARGWISTSGAAPTGETIDDRLRD